jgi:hypothetical protein
MYQLLSLLALSDLATSCTNSALFITHLLFLIVLKGLIPMVVKKWVVSKRALPDFAES